MRFAIVLTLAFLVSLNLSAQKNGNKRANYKLLWRISGNGLARPSYLFGTMHAQDKRAFDLNDSVIAKVIQCEAFALEVHPDSITRFMAAIILDEEKNKSIESQMSPKEFAHYDSLLTKKTGISLKKFKTVKQAKYFLEQRSLKKDHSTFLDAWLYNIARENGKTMTGLEEVSVQANLLLDADSTELNDFKRYLVFETDVDKSMQTMLGYYYEGDAEAIYSFANSMTPKDKFEKMIIDRNINMTSSIIHEIHKHSTFIAVGAAHLGGGPGIVNLLKQKGYAVTPVTAPFSGTASKYKSTNTIAGQWHTFSSVEGGYSVEMPQRPFPLKKSDLPLTFQTYLDIGTLTVFMSAHFPIGTIVENQAVTKMLDQMVKNMSASQKVNSLKKITVDGHEGRELETSANGYVFRVMITIAQSNAYMLMVGPTKESVNSPDSKRFMSSLKLMKPTTTSAQVENVVSKEGAYSVDMPGKITNQVTNPVDGTSGKPYKINVSFSTDNAGGTYIVRYNDFPAGYVASNDSIYAFSTMQVVYEKMAGVELSTKNINFHGYPSTHFKFLNEKRNVAAEGVMLLRGQRFYMLMNTRPNNSDAELAGKAFLDSFKFSPFEKPELKSISFPEGFTLKVPQTFEADSTIVNADGTNTYSFVDRLSGTMFLATPDVYSKYDQVENVDSLFSYTRRKYVDAKDGKRLRDVTTGSNPPTHEYEYQLPNSNTILKIRSVLVGDRLISLWAYLPSNDPNIILPDQVFDSFKVTYKSDWNLFSDKSDLILKDVTSSDSTERAQAGSTLVNHTFKTRHLPKIYEILRKPSGDDNKWSGIRNRLFATLSDTHDQSTQPFIEQLYPTLPDTTSLRDRALSVLSSMKTRESVKKLTDLLLNDKSTHTFNSYTVFNSLDDSLSLLTDVLPILLDANSKFAQPAQLYRLTKMAIDSSVFTADQKGQLINRITRIASTLADKHLPADDDDYYTLMSEKYYVLATLFSVPFTPEVESIVRKFEAEDYDNNRLLCLQILLKNNVAVPVKDINSLAAKPDMRLSVYDELVKYNKLDLMEKKYTTQKMLAESEAYESLYEMDEYPEKVEFLKEKPVIVNGEKMKILVFTYGYKDEKEVFPIITGPYPLKPKAYSRGDLTTALYDEYKDDKDLNEQLSKYLKEHNGKLDVK